MVDSAKITIKAGNGGNGVVHFHRGRFIPKGGPDGGDGGKGGNVYMTADANLSTLDHFAYRQKMEAKSGRSGSEGKSSGLAGEDLEIKVPLGTIVQFRGEGENGELKTIDFDKIGMRLLIAKGGKGGRGNWRFRSSVNTTPMQAEDGQPGEAWMVEMDLKLLADVGLVGLPNVGKSTLLSILSSAKPKIADYEFTTLEPNLGVLKFDGGRSLVIADIPGLVEGASEGKGLGIRFLRHIERTKSVVHVLALKNGEEELSADEAADRLISNYKLIRNEMKKYAEDLVNKKEIVVLNKTDLLDDNQVDSIVAILKKKKINAIKISAGNLSGIEELKQKLYSVVSALEI